MVFFSDSTLMDKFNLFKNKLNEINAGIGYRSIPDTALYWNIPLYKYKGQDHVNIRDVYKVYEKRASGFGLVLRRLTTNLACWWFLLGVDQQNKLTIYIFKVFLHRLPVHECAIFRKEAVATVSSHAVFRFLERNCNKIDHALYVLCQAVVGEVIRLEKQASNELLVVTQYSEKLISSSCGGALALGVSEKSGYQEQDRPNIVVKTYLSSSMLKRDNLLECEDSHYYHTDKVDSENVFDAREINTIQGHKFKKNIPAEIMILPSDFDFIYGQQCFTDRFNKLMKKKGVAINYPFIPA